MRLLIAFGGKMGSGKDTAVEYLRRRYTGTQHSFAKPLYDILGYAQRTCNFDQEKDRKFLQFVGTDWARGQDPDIWLNIALNKTPKTGNVFLSDLRFPNELSGLKGLGWYCVKIERRHQYGREGTGKHEHSSELMLDGIPDKDWDLILSNDGDLPSFYAELDKMISSIKCK